MRGVLVGNLGIYQTMTTVMKAMGGPAKALTLGVAVVGTAGYGVIRLGEFGGKKLIEAAKATLANRRARSEVIEQVFTIHTDGVADDGLEFKAGGQYRALEQDGDAVLIELFGDGDGHYVSGAFLATISDFPAELPAADE